MSPTTIIVGIASPLIVASIIGTVKIIRRRRENAVRLTGQVSVSSELPILQQIGCPCLLVKIVNKGSRTARIQRCTLAIQGANVIPAFERAFPGANFGTLPANTSAKDVIFRIELLPKSMPNYQNGWKLDNDETAEFLVPMLAAGLPIATVCPSEDVWIFATLFDETNVQLIRGFIIGSHVQSLFAMHNNASGFVLKHAVNIGITVRVTHPPTSAPVVGEANPRPLVFDPNEIFGRPKGN